MKRVEKSKVKHLMDRSDRRKHRKATLGGKLVTLAELLEKVGTLKIRRLAFNVYVRGDKVVIVDPATNLQITQFKNSRANTHKRIESGRWKPIP